jgi:hypothetical protein
MLWTIKSWLGRRQAHALATVSKYSRHTIVERFGMPADRVHVVSEAPDAVFRVLDDVRPTPRLAALGLGGLDLCTVTFVGGFGPHKNLDSLVGVVRRLLASGTLSDVRFVLVGEYRNEGFHGQAAYLQEPI